MLQILLLHLSVLALGCNLSVMEFSLSWLMGLQGDFKHDQSQRCIEPHDLGISLLSDYCSQSWRKSFRTQCIVNIPVSCYQISKERYHFLLYIFRADKLTCHKELARSISSLVFKNLRLCGHWSNLISSDQVGNCEREIGFLRLGSFEWSLLHHLNMFLKLWEALINLYGSRVRRPKYGKTKPYRRPRPRNHLWHRTSHQENLLQADFICGQRAH